VDRALANSESIGETGQKVESPTLAAKRRPAYKRLAYAMRSRRQVSPAH
jgi:hypothetical protein